MRDANQYFQNRDLDRDSIFHPGNEIGVLLIHGFTATPVEVEKLAGFFIKKGLTVSAPLLPGHGTSPYDLNTKKYQDWTACVEETYSRLRASCRKVIVCGESMGAVLSLYLAQKHVEISALCLFSTALLVGRLRYAKYIKYFKPLMDKNLPEDGLPWQGYTVYPTRAAHEFYKLTRLVEKSLASITSPTILFQGKYDQTIDVKNIDFIFRRISSPVKQKIMMGSSGHVMLLDQEVDIIKQKIESFLFENQIL